VDSSRITFADLIEQLHAGDPAAAAPLFRSYNRVIREAVRRRLPTRLRNEFESLDFAQEVWAAICALPPGNCYFETPRRLEAYLIEIAIHKVIDAYRHRNAARNGGPGRNAPLTPVAGSEPTPSQWAIAGERWASIAASLPPSHVAIVERLCEGFTAAEVAAMAGVSQRCVNRIVARVHRICEEVEV